MVKKELNGRGRGKNESEVQVKASGSDEGGQLAHGLGIDYRTQQGKERGARGHKALCPITAGALAADLITLGGSNPRTSLDRVQHNCRPNA